jgi:MFS transporter, MHS family, citrate/tricarballylate:H+ symporter
MLLLMATTVSGYGLSDITTYAQDSLRLAAGIAFGATIMNGLCNLTGDLSSGCCGTRLGANPLCGSPSSSCLFCLRISHDASSGGAHGVCSHASLVRVTADFRQRGIGLDHEIAAEGVRSTGLAILYALATAAFGGTTRLVIKLLTEATGNTLAPD